jgi:ATPase subunit of ABC transporter with duplicated ATPase domains
VSSKGIVGDEDGYTADSDAAILLQGLDIPDALHKRTMAELQGGQKVRVLLAQALFANPDVLLLDEPTNHLDLDSIHWLRDFLLRYPGILIVISHRRHFLNAVCTHIADIDYQTISRTPAGTMTWCWPRRRCESESRPTTRSARKNRAAQRFHRQVFRGHPGQPGGLPPQGGRAAADHGPRAVEHTAAVHPLQDEPAVGCHRA